MCAVSAIYFHWAGLGNIKRPEADVQYGVVVGISSSNQFSMLQEGGVLVRSHSCWCPTCFDVASGNWSGRAPRALRGLQGGWLHEGGQRFLRLQQKELPRQNWR
jgi:hypothetical protein